jgi:hypothetical protein
MENGKWRIEGKSVEGRKDIPATGRLDEGARGGWRGGEEQTKE